MKKTLTLLFLSFLAQYGMAQFNTNLPIIKLNMNQPIVDTYAMASMDIIDNSSGINNYNDVATQTSNAGVRLRGNAVSQSLS